MCRGVWSGVSVCVYVSVGVAGTMVKVHLGVSTGLFVELCVIICIRQNCGT